MVALSKTYDLCSWLPQSSFKLLLCFPKPSHWECRSPCQCCTAGSQTSGVDHQEGLQLEQITPNNCGILGRLSTRDHMVPIKIQATKIYTFVWTLETFLSIYFIGSQILLADSCYSIHTHSKIFKSQTVEQEGWLCSTLKSDTLEVQKGDTSPQSHEPSQQVKNRDEKVCKKKDTEFPD